MLSSKDTSKTTQLKNSRRKGLLSGFLAGIFFLFFIFSMTYIYNNKNKIIEAQKILNENKLLKQKLTDLTVTIDSMLIKLKMMEEWEDQIRSEQNFKKIKKDIREMGIGGLPQIDSTFISINKDISLKYNITLNKITQLNNRIDFNYGTHAELLENYQLKESLFRNTPSIYPAYARITDAYGWRIHPINKKRSFHYGIDFANAKGTPIYATADGIVIKTDRHAQLGRYVKLEHKFGYETKYAHLQKINVKPGQKVKRGQIIGTMGSSGRTTGTHLHYEVSRYGKHRNPYKYLNKSKSDIILAKK